MVHDQPPDQLSLRVHLVLHLHDFDHVQVDRLGERVDAGGIGGRRGRGDGKDGVDDGGREVGGELGMELGGEGGVGDGDEG
jgi:hypothetical protein